MKQEKEIKSENKRDNVDTLKQEACSPNHQSSLHLTNEDVS